MIQHMTYLVHGKVKDCIYFCDILFRAHSLNVLQITKCPNQVMVVLMPTAQKRENIPIKNGHGALSFYAR